MIIDNTPENFQKQPENGIVIKSWFGDPNDQALIQLAPLLKRKLFFIKNFVEIVTKSLRDVRIALKQFREKMIDNIMKGIINPHLNLSLSEEDD